MKRRYVCTAILLSAAFFALPVCSQAQFTPAEGIAEEHLSARSAPAMISKESEESLKSKGYVLIGAIGMTQAIGEGCWGNKCSAFACPSGAGSVELTSRLLPGAAAHGGDVLVLQDDNTVKKVENERKGKCASKFDKCDYKNVCDANWNCRMRTLCHKECMTWNWEKGFACSVTSRGNVWRLEPGLPARIAARKEKAAEEAKAAKERFAAAEAKRVAAEVRRAAEAKAHVEKEALTPVARAFLAVEPAGPTGLSPFQENDKWGYRDARGSIVIAPRYQGAARFADGLARVRINDKVGFIDPTGALVIPAKFDAASKFSDGLAAAGSGKKQLELKWGFIDKNGSFVIQKQFDGVHPFSEGLAAAAIGKLLDFRKDRWGYIDKSGKWVIRRQFYDAGEFSGGLAPVATGTLLTHVWGYINAKGEFVIEPSFGDAEAFSEDLAKVEVEGKCGYINRDGQFVIQPQFSYASAFHDGAARVVLNGKTGFVDKSGKFIASE